MEPGDWLVACLLPIAQTVLALLIALTVLHHSRRNNAVRVPIALCQKPKGPCSTWDRAWPFVRHLSRGNLRVPIPHVDQQIEHQTKVTSQTGFSLYVGQIQTCTTVSERRIWLAPRPCSLVRNGATHIGPILTKPPNKPCPSCADTRPGVLLIVTRFLPGI